MSMVIDVVNALKILVIVVGSIALLCKLFLASRLVVYSQRASASPIMKKLVILMAGVIIGSMFDGSFWLMRAVKAILLPEISLNYTIFHSRMAWAFFVIQNLSTIFFLEYLVNKTFRINILQRIFFALLSFSFIGFLFFAFFRYSEPVSSGIALQIETKLVQITLILFISFFVVTIRRILSVIKRENLPQLLIHQVKTFILFFLIPYIAFEFLIHNVIMSKIFFIVPIFHSTPFNIVSVIFSEIFITTGLYYCLRKMISSRFLNINKRVQGPALSVRYPTELKDAISRLNMAQSFSEVDMKVKHFFKDVFDVPLDSMRFYIRYTGEEILPDERLSEAPEEMRAVEHFMETLYAKNSFEARVLHIDQALFYDELEFSHYYDDKHSAAGLLSFLNRLNADAFLPVYEGATQFSGALIIKKGVRGDRLYSRAEQDAMTAFIGHVSMVVTGLYRRNYYSMVQMNKEMKEEIAHRDLEKRQYRESIHSFVRTTKEHKIGVVYYRNRNFIVANAEARELLQSDPNSEHGDLLSNSLRIMARDVEEFHTEKEMLTKNVRGTKLKITAFHHPEHHSVVMLIHRPEINDLVKMQADILKDPTMWDYLLWLDTTKAGETLNKLLPGMGTTVLNFKISLLETALGVKATLLDMTEEDAGMMVEVIHAISEKKHLHTIKLTSPERDKEVAIKLFGVNKLLLPTEQKTEEALMEKLDEVGTLYIQDIHFLSLETQEMLAKFIRFGLYSPVKSDHEISTRVRIICSSTQNLSQLVQEERFSKNLLHELKKMVIVLPAFHELSKEEMTDLAEGYKQHLMQEDTYRNFLAFTEKDKNNLLADRPVSLGELKTRVKSIVASKTEKHNISDLTEFDPAYYIADPDISRAARLGKKALRDKKLLSALLVKFEYNQAKIGTLLGVNRSTVHRRCISYNLSESTLVKFTPLKKIETQEPKVDQESL